MRHLVESWLRTAARVGARGDVAGVGADLLSRYADTRRRHHDLTHLDEVLRHVDELAGFAGDPDNARLAAWFHDAVYDPTSQDSEERSAQLAATALGELRVHDARAGEVARLVRLTTTHRPDEDDRDGAVLCDADLAVLAAGPERYLRYAAGVRTEYAHLGDHDYASGRAAVLRGLLARETLFRTPTARAAWEDRARLNLTAELARLAP